MKTYINKFISLPINDKILFLYGSLLGTLFLLIIKLLPVKYYVGLLKSGETYSDYNRDHLISALNAIRRIGKISGSYKNCLVKSLTLKFLLRAFNINSNVVLAIRNNPGQLIKAHAYLEINKGCSVFKMRSYNDLY